jgi:hypothetical protein
MRAFKRAEMTHKDSFQLKPIIPGIPQEEIYWLSKIYNVTEVRTMREEEFVEIVRDAALALPDQDAFHRSIGKNVQQRLRMVEGSHNEKKNEIWEVLRSCPMLNVDHIRPIIPGEDILSMKQFITFALPVLLDRWRQPNTCQNCQDRHCQNLADKKRKISHRSDLPQHVQPKNKALAMFLRNVPRPNEWRKKQIELGLNTAKDYQQVIQGFTTTSATITEETFQADGHSQNQLVRMAESLASFTNPLVNRFQVLILLSYCIVLEKRGTPYETIDKMIQHLWSRQCGRKTLLDAASRINRIIVKLIRHGWDIQRVTELFFFGISSGHLACEAALTIISGALSVSNLLLIDEEIETALLQYLGSHEFVTNDYGDCLIPEYTFPGLVASLTIGKLSYGFQTCDEGSVNKSVIGLMKYALLLVTT